MKLGDPMDPKTDCRPLVVRSCRHKKLDDQVTEGPSKQGQQSFSGEARDQIVKEHSINPTILTGLLTPSYAKL